MTDDLPHGISHETTKRAYVLAKNSIAIGLEIGSAKFNSHACGDMICFAMCNTSDICVIMCTPYCYLVEYYLDNSEGDPEAHYFMMKNIRNFLFKLNKMNFASLEDWGIDIPEVVEDDEDFED